MVPQTFQGRTMNEALARVRAALGRDAVILHTRTYHRRQWLGLRRYQVCEIMAKSESAKPPRTPPAAPAGPARLLDTPAATGAMLVGLASEMAALKGLVTDLVNRARSQQAPQVPEQLLEHYTHLIQNHVAEELAAEVVRSIQSQVHPEHLRNRAFVQDKLAEQLERLLPAAGPLVRTKAHGPHVVALIGPTGVGKTTTIAKLAANLKLRERRSVGLITMDTYRIAAVEQLRKYADIIGSPLEVVMSPEDLKEKLTAMAQREFVLIDTAGRSPGDAIKLGELRAAVAAAQPDEVHLVLSATASPECLEWAARNFGQIRVDKLIFTKLDEAVHLGTVLNMVRKVNKKLSYITNGQDVPDDIAVGEPRRLARLILGCEGASLK